MLSLSFFTLITQVLLAREGGVGMKLEMCMGMGKTGIPWLPWDSHGIPMGMGIRSAIEWEWDGNGNEVHGHGN